MLVPWTLLWLTQGSMPWRRHGSENTEVPCDFLDARLQMPVLTPQCRSPCEGVPAGRCCDNKSGSNDHRCGRRRIRCGNTQSVGEGPGRARRPSSRENRERDTYEDMYC